MLPTPGVEALHDEELLARPHLPDPPCIAREHLDAGRLLEPRRDTCLLRPEHIDLGATRGELVPSLRVRRDRAGVEERDDTEHEHAENETGT